VYIFYWKIKPTITVSRFIVIELDAVSRDGIEWIEKAQVLTK